MNTCKKYIILLLVIFLFTSCKKEKPEVVTSDVWISSKYPTFVTIYGKVEEDGGKMVTTRGVIINTNGKPNLDNYEHIAEAGKGIGNFSASFRPLITNKNYYARAFASNGIGTRYGNEISFTTYAFDFAKPCEKTPTVTDYDGNVYKTVRIGDQCWMAENLRSRHYADGQNIYDKYSVSHYNDTVYGKLYSWNAVRHNDTVLSADTIGVQGICPDGWHIPSYYEWSKLINYLGYKAGSHLKQSGTEHWAEPNIADNLSGFTALPAGYRDNSNYDYPAIGEEANFWTCNGEPTEYHNASIIILENERSGVIKSVNYPNKYALSVRCIKDK